VLSGSHQPPASLTAHRALATRHIVVDGSAHWIHLDQPSLVADAVLAVVTRRVGMQSPSASRRD
jgi:pimeloyl-ACP methyl ester carboxylesterase